MNNDNDMLATQKIKYIIAVILAVVIGVMFAISTKNIRTFGAALIVAAYFGMQLFETIQNEKKGKYRKITALAVSADESRSGLGTVETWRFIPVDENGEYIDTNGRLDIFLQIKPKERNYHIGGTYSGASVSHGDYASTDGTEVYLIESGAGNVMAFTNSKEFVTSVLGLQ